MSPDDTPAERQQETQLTQPRGVNKQTGKPYEPVEIPVPNRKDVLDALEKAARTRPDTGSSKGR